MAKANAVLANQKGRRLWSAGMLAKGMERKEIEGWMLCHMGVFRRIKGGWKGREAYTGGGGKKECGKGESKEESRRLKEGRVRVGEEVRREKER